MYKRMSFRFAHHFLILFSLTLFLAGCKSQQKIWKEEAFNEFIGSIPMNQELVLQAPTIIGDESDATIHLSLINYGEEVVEISNVSSVSLLAYAEDLGWYELTNLSKYPNSFKIHPGPSETMCNIRAISATPDFRQIEDLDRIRFVVIGTIYRDDQPTDMKVGANFGLEEKGILT